MDIGRHIRSGWDYRQSNFSLISSLKHWSIRAHDVLQTQDVGDNDYRQVWLSNLGNNNILYFLDDKIFGD